MKTFQTVSQSSVHVFLSCKS